MPTHIMFRTLLLLLSLAFSATIAAGQCSSPSFNAGLSVGVGTRPSDITSADFNGDGITDLALTNANFISVLLGNAAGVPVQVRVPINGGRIAAADFNNDGKTDLAVTTGSSGTRVVAIVLGDGMGGFGAQTNFAVNATDALAVADFNNDGNADVLVGSSSTGTSQLLFGTGSGSLGPPLTVTLPNTAFIKAADFNRDGKVDLAVVNGNISILLGDGAGHFGAANNLPVSQARSLNAADFNSDGKLDLVTVGQADGVSVLLGDGAGSFGTVTNFSTGFSALAVGVGDFNGDGKPDLAPAGSSTVAILLGTGTGTFGPVTGYHLSRSPLAIAVGDFDGDGKLDVATANAPPDLPPLLGDPPPDTASILFGDGTGKLRYPSVISTAGSPFSIASGDVNGDGKADLAVAHLNSNNSVLLLLGDGAGGFSAPASIPVGAQPGSVTLGDLNGDRQLDLITVNSGTISILLGDGSGGFGAPTLLSVPGFNPDYAAVADFNNDGLADLAVVYLNTGSVSILLGNGAGGFGPATNFTVPSGAQYVVVNDFNGDGKSDLAIAVISGVSILLGNGNGGFGPAQTLPTSSTVYAVAAGDFNSDGKADLAAAIVNTRSVLIYLGNGQGGFASPATLQVYDGPNSLVAADYNGDGHADLATANSPGNVSVLLGDGAGSFAAAVTYIDGGYTPRSLTNGDFNSDGRPDIAVANQGGNSTPAPTPLPTNISVLFNACSAPPPLVPALSVSDVAVTEGDAGNVNMTFNVSLSAASSKTVAVSFYTTAQDALKDVDYQTTAGRVSFAPGVTTQTLTVSVPGDALDEFDEHFAVVLAHPLNANISKGQGLGTILDNDPPPTVSINAVTLSEGNAGTRAATFNVALSAPSGKPITLSFATADGSARASTDYQAISGTLTFSPGQTTKTINVLINGDTFDEPDETFFVILSAPANVIIATAQGMGTILNDDAPTLQFSAPSYQFGEGGARALLTVTRAGDTSGIITVEYQTADTDNFTVGCSDTVNNHGGAYARCDFATVLGTLTFAANDVQPKSIIVPLIDDAYVEGAETFQVRLSNPVGAALGAVATAIVTIQDNDSATGANPVFSSPFFVRQHYLDFLSREPEESGLAAWLRVLNNCADVNNVDPNSPSAGCDRLTVSASFFGSQEFQLKGFYVFRFYKVAFGRRPDYAEIIPDMSLVAGSTDTEVYARKAQLAASFTQRQEFQTAYGGMTDAQYVAALLSRYGLATISTPNPATPDDSNTKVTLTHAELVARLGNGSMTRGQVLRAVADSDQVSAAEFNRAFVAMQYYGYLRRTPEDAGYNAWLNYLNAHPTDFRTMVNGFMNSTEYRLRFGQP